MDIQEAKEILERYNAGICSEAEKTLVENSFLVYSEEDIDFSPAQMNKIKREIYAKLPVPQPSKLKLYAWASAAAAVLIFIMAIVHWRLEENLQVMDQAVAITDVAPMGNRATLSLDGGNAIALNGAKGGLVVAGNGLQYLDGSAVDKAATTPLWQTLSTPRGSQYQVVLADGTKVWLNAASSISYPSSFEGASERKVSITGEAYFEVAPDKAKPFLVQSPTQLIRVLGTHFNVNDYRDGGSTMTTLLEGSVSVVQANGHREVLKPMQQLRAGNGTSQVIAADAALALAWKNGVLEFKEASIRDIMKEVARWYDLEVEYRGAVPNRVFNGSISRKSNLSVLLKILSFSNISFRMETINAHTKLIVEP